MPIITLTTDFGPSSHYVGLMKGVILDTAPGAKVVDFTHTVPAHDIAAGAVLLESLLGYFPDGSIHVAVVDPGVGGPRAPIAVQTRRCFWVGPDNGLFTEVAQHDPVTGVTRLTNPRYHRHPVSPTFHGRDIFAPVAAHLANGVPLEHLGQPIDVLAPLELPQPIMENDQLTLHVVYADRFGNLVTDLRQDLFVQWAGADHRDIGSFEVRIAQTRIPGLSRTFSDVPVGQWLAYFGSTGRLEIAIRQGNAAEQLPRKPTSYKPQLWRYPASV